MSNDFVEMSDDLASALSDVNQRIDGLSDQLRAAEHQKQQLLDNAVAPLAEFEVGATVIADGRKCRITKVSGETFGLTGQRPKVWLRYHGERLKVDGSAMGRERRLYEIQQLPAES